jgi:hypothetical protein
VRCARLLVGEPSQERLALEPQHAPEACRRHRGVVLGPPEDGSFVDLEHHGDLPGGEEYRQQRRGDRWPVPSRTENNSAVFTRFFRSRLETSTSDASDGVSGRCLPGHLPGRPGTDIAFRARERFAAHAGSSIAVVIDMCGLAAPSRMVDGRPGVQGRVRRSMIARRADPGVRRHRLGLRGGHVAVPTEAPAVVRQFTELGVSPVRTHDVSMDADRDVATKRGRRGRRSSCGGHRVDNARSRRCTRLPHWRGRGRGSDSTSATGREDAAPGRLRNRCLDAQQGGRRKSRKDSEPLVGPSNGGVSSCWCLSI